MKRFWVLALAVAVTVGLAGIASAHMWGYDDDGPGYGYGMGPGMMYGYGSAGNVSVDKFKQFQKETSGLRDELVLKQVELRSEFAKDKPDTDKIASLRKDIIDLRTKIDKAADKAGLDDNAGPARGRGYHRGYGMMYGGGGGYGCGMW
jgi:hypothetical protein